MKFIEELLEDCKKNHNMPMKKGLMPESIQCPACKMAEGMYKFAKARFPGEILDIPMSLCSFCPVNPRVYTKHNIMTSSCIYGGRKYLEKLKGE